MTTIRPVMRRFLFWKWHAPVPYSFQGESSVCCDQRMKQYEAVDRLGPPKDPIARCTVCGRQFAYQEAPGSGGDVDIWHIKIADTHHPLAT
jgi:hypothetical protein